MTPEAVLRELLDLAQQVGLSVRVESLLGRGAGPGGLCKLRGEWVLLVNESAPAVEQLGVLAEALAPLSDIPAETLSVDAHRALSLARSRRLRADQRGERRKETEAERALRTGVHLRGVTRIRQ